MPRNPTNKANENPRALASGAFAILGMDVVSFSTYTQVEQVQIISELNKFIQEALSGRSLDEGDYLWSSAGDGGYITFLDPSAPDVPLDVVFAIFERVKSTGSRGLLRRGFLIRAGLHAGTVQEGLDMAGKTNIWGVGINETARIVSIADNSQLLVSKEYHDLFAKHLQGSEYLFGRTFQRTVKHGVSVQVMNADKRDLGLTQEEAESRRWNCIGASWHRTVSEYEAFISDALWCRDSVAAIAAASFLLRLGEEQKVREMCEVISLQGNSVETPRAAKQAYLSHLPPVLLLDAIRKIKPRMVKAGERICTKGESADSCFFVASGRLMVQIPGGGAPVVIKAGDIVGEFSLWIPGLRRTATVEAEQDSLLLELSHADFTVILEHNHEIAASVYSVIKGRVVQNVFNSKSIFPIPKSPARDEVEGRAVCNRYPAGEVLNLKEDCFILFFGKVAISVADKKRLEISAAGRFDQLPVIGITSQIGAPDGRRADVLADSFAIRISQAKLLELRSASEDVAAAWSALCGRRLHEAGISLAGFAEAGAS